MAVQLEAVSGVAPARTAQAGRSLAHRLARWVALSTGASLLVFASLAYGVVILEEDTGVIRDTPEVTARARSEVGNALLVAGPICLALAVAGTVVLTRRTLQPLDQLTHAAKQITPRALDQRLPVPQIEDEVHAAVLALNDLLARLESGFTTLERFASDASHELRTPLAVIGTELEVMLRSPRSIADWEVSAATCLDEVHHLTRLIDALLRMARADSAAASGAAVEIQTVIEEVLAALGTRAQERGVELRAVPAPGAGEAIVLGDEDALTSALINIVDNAIRYTPAGGEVLVSSLAQGGKVLVHVDDSGPGVGPDEREQIFEPFRRGAAARESDRGFGLGLAIARRICEHNDATLCVGSSPRGGARFSLTFAAQRPV